VFDEKASLKVYALPAKRKAMIKKKTS